MLNRIHIQNFAISSEAEVELAAGMSVLTGETGAGKSILIDALNLVLGDRADAGVVRHGTERATINASFQLEKDSPALYWLKEQELDDSDECHLRRVISAEGRSRAFINNSPANLSALKSLGEMLIEIHGQHEHQSLMKSSRQRQQLDSAGDYSDLIRQVADTAIELKECQRQLNLLKTHVNDNAAQLELLHYQTAELKALAIDELDIPALLQEHERISHADSLRELGWNACQQLKDSDEQSIQHQIGQLISELESWSETSPDIRSALEIINDISSLTDEAAQTLQQMQDGLETDPKRLSELEQLMSELHALARKHDIRMQDLPDHYNDKIQQLASIDQSETDLSELEARQQQLHQQYEALTQQLHQQRKTTAEQLSSQVTHNMQQLGMQGGQFEIQVNLLEPAENISRHGRDEIVYMVSANPGQPLQPLQKVASGGELSRISLAITVICAAANQAATMIFDEIDSGIGGGVAEIVGKELEMLGTDRQVLCVTHLPQVAAQGHHHFRVVKTSSNEHTESRVISLDDEGRIQEIARMLGGVDITEQSLAHAQELLGLTGAAKAS